MTTPMKPQDGFFESRYMALVSSHADLVSRYKPNYELVFVSPSYCQFFGRPAAYLFGRSILDLLADEDQRQATRDRLASITLDSPSVRTSDLVIRADGSIRNVDWVTSGIFDENGLLVEFQSVGRDMTDYLHAQEELNKSRTYYKQAAQIAGIGYWIWDNIEDRLEFCTDEAAAIYGVTVEQSLARVRSSDRRDSTKHPDDFDHYETTIRNAHENRTGFDVVYRIYRPDGELRYIRQLGEPIFDHAGNIIKTIGTLQDITEQKLAEEEIAHMARHDALTGIPNRTLFIDRLETDLKSAKREKRQLAVLFIDLDGFKVVNDTAGHQTGDQVLIHFAHRLRNCIRDMDTIGRIGGDEFAIVLSGDVTRDHVVLVVEKILEAVSAPYDLEGKSFLISASIGISLDPGDGDAPDSLLTAADAAMYDVKRSGKNSYRFATVD